MDLVKLDRLKTKKETGSDWNWNIFYCGDLIIATKRLGIVGIDHNSPTQIHPPENMVLMGVTLVSAHPGVYNGYRKYINYDENICYAFFDGSSNGHTTNIVMIGHRI